jgi:hypothetical protein
MRVHAGVLITKIGIGNMVVLIPQIKRGAAVGCEQLHSATKLSGEVEVRLPKHPVVEIEEAATTREERFDAAVVYEIHLCTDRTTTDTVGIHSVTIPSARIAHQCRGYVENPANREWFFPVNEPFIPILELIIPCVYRVGESVAISKGTTIPEGVFAVGMLSLFLRERRGQKKHTNENSAGYGRHLLEKPNPSSSIAAKDTLPRFD